MFLINLKLEAKASHKLLKLKFFLLIFLSGLCACTSESLPQNPAGSELSLQDLEPLSVENPEGSIVPDFQLYDLDSRSFRLYEILDAGNYVLLNFWATWCPPCIEELPSMEDLNKRWKGRLFSLIAVSVDDQPGEVIAFLDQLKPREPSFLILHDPGKLVASGLYASEKFPETFLIGPDRKLRKKFVGPRNWTDQAVLKELNALMQAKAQ